jgi:Holliday junction resolvase
LHLSYTIGTFGREAEYIVTFYLRIRGWRVTLSKGSRGPADILAINYSKRGRKKWLIQVKSSRKAPRIRGYEIHRLIAAAALAGGEPIIATLQPKLRGENDSAKKPCENSDHHVDSAIKRSRFAVCFFSLPDWRMISP